MFYRTNKYLRFCIINNDIGAYTEQNNNNQKLVVYYEKKTEPVLPFKIFSRYFNRSQFIFFR